MNLSTGVSLSPLAHHSAAYHVDKHALIPANLLVGGGVRRYAITVLTKKPFCGIDGV